MARPSLPVHRVEPRIARSLLPAPGFRRGATGELEHLDHSAGGECLHHGAARRLDFRSRLAYLHTGDALDLLAQRSGGVGEQLAVELLNLRRTAASTRSDHVMDKTC